MYLSPDVTYSDLVIRVRPFSSQGTAVRWSREIPGHGLEIMLRPLHRAGPVLRTLCLTTGRRERKYAVVRAVIIVLALIALGVLIVRLV